MNLQCFEISNQNLCNDSLQYQVLHQAHSSLDHFILGTESLSCPSASTSVLVEEYSDDDRKSQGQRRTW